MKLSTRQLLAPFAGALLGFFASKGYAAPPGTAEWLITLGAGLISGLVHLLEVRMHPGAAAVVTTVAGKADPAKPASSAGPGPGNVAKALLCGLAVGALLQLQGCASLGLAPAVTPADKLGYAYAAVNASLGTLHQALAAGQVSSAQGTAINADIMAAAAQLDTARALLCGPDPTCAHPASSPTALTAISAATQALTAVSAYLTCRQTKGAACPLP